MRKRSLLAVLLILLLLVPEPLLAPWLEAPPVAEAAAAQAGGCPSGSCRIDYTATQAGGTYGFNVLFHECFGTARYLGQLPSGEPYGPVTFSGVGAYISRDGKYVYIAAGDGVHVIDLERGKEAAVAKTPGATFCANSPVGMYLRRLSPEQLAEGPNGTVVAAPHFNNPYVVYPNGSKREIPVYSQDEVRDMYSYHIVNEGTDYFWGNSKGIAAFNYNGQVYWKKDYSGEGGIRQVSAKNTVAALSGDGTLHLLDKNTGNEVKTIKKVRAVAPTGSHYVALDEGNQTPIALLYDDGTLTDPFYTIDDAIAKMASGTSRNVTALFALSPTKLYILFIVNETQVIDTWSHPVKASSIKVKKEDSTLLFTTFGSETLVGRVDGTQVTILSYTKNDQPSVGGDVMFAKLPEYKTENGTTVKATLPLNGSVLLAEVFEAGACARIALLNPAPLKPGPHVEVRGVAVGDVSLSPGKAAVVSFTPFTPLRVTVELGRLERTKIEVSLIQKDRSGFPSVTPMYSDGVAPLALGAQAGRTRSFWNLSLYPSGGLRADYRFEATVYASPAGASRSVPVASLAVFWYKLVPTRIDAYDQILVTAAISSTGVSPKNAEMIVASNAIEYAAGFLLSVVSTKALAKSLYNFLKSAPTGADKLVEVVKVPATEEAKKDSSLFQRILGGIKGKMEEYVGDAGKVEVKSTVKVGGADKIAEAAAKQGVSADQLNSAMKAATEEAFKTKVDAALQAISPKERADAAVKAWMSTLNAWAEEAAKSGSIKVTIEGNTYTLTKDQVLKLQELFQQALIQRAKAADLVAYQWRLGLDFKGKSAAEALEFLYEAMRTYLVKSGVPEAQAQAIAEAYIHEAVFNAVAEMAAEASKYVGEEGAKAIGAWFVAVPSFLGVAALFSKRAEAAVPTPDEVAAHLKTALVGQGVDRSKAQAVADAVVKHGFIVWLVQDVSVEVTKWPNWWAIATVSGVPLALKILSSVAGTATLFGVTVNFVALPAALALTTYFATQFIIALITTVAIGPGTLGSTVVRGVAFLASLPGGGKGLYIAIESLPQVKVSWLRGQSLSDALRSTFEASKGSLGVAKVVVEEVGTHFNSIDWKSKLAQAFGGSAVLEEAGPAVLPAFWAQPSMTMDISTSWVGVVDVNAFDVAGVVEKREVLTGERASLPPEVWKELRVTAYAEGVKELGDFVPYEVQEGGRKAVFIAPQCLYNVRRIDLVPGEAWDVNVEAVVRVEGAIIADAVLAIERSGTYRAVAEWESALEFETVAVGVFGFEKIYAVGSQMGLGKEFWLNYSDVQRYWDNQTKTLFVPGKFLTGNVGKHWVTTFWIYTQPYEVPSQKPSPTPTPCPTPTPTPTPTPGNVSEGVVPSPHTPTIPPNPYTNPGEVWIGMYLNGTFPFATLPTILTVYLFTVDEAVVRFSVNYTISVEEGNAWISVESGNIMNGTVSMPGNYSMAYNARIAHLVEKAALLASRSGTPAVVAFYGRAARLDTNKTCNAYLAVPVLPGHLPTQPSASVTLHVYDAATLNPIEGANVTLSGPASYTALTNSSGYAYFENVRNGTYALAVSASGYKSFSTAVTVARNLLLHVPLLPEGVENMSALLVKVRTSDGFPLEGAAVYVNGSFVGVTDSYGEWGAIYPWGSTLNVSVSYGGWSARQQAVMLWPRVLVVFEYPNRSQYFRPQVSAIFVQAPQSRVGAGRTTAALVAVMVNSNNTYTAEVGFKKDGVVVSKTTVTRSPSRSMLDIFTVEVNATVAGTLVPYLNVTWAAADDDPRDNYVEGEPIKAVTRVGAALGIFFDVEEWAFGVPGLIYPGETVFRVNVTLWVRGPKVRMVKPMKLKVAFNHRLLTAYSQPLGEAVVTELDNSTAVFSALVTCPYARYVSPVLEVVDYGDAGDEYEVSITEPGEGEIELPPHVIVKEEAELANSVVKVGDKVKVKVRVWTNLVKPGEGRNAKLYFHLGKMENESLRFTAWSDVFDLKPGDQAVETEAPFPKDFKMQWYEVYKEEEGNFFLGSVADSWGADNWAKATIRIFNTSTAFFWIAAGIAVIIALLLLIAFIKAAFAARAARAASEWLEDSGPEGGWLEALKRAPKLARFPTL